MPDRYFEELKHNKIYASFTAIFALLIVCAPILAVAIWKYSVMAGSFLGTLFIASVSVFIFILPQIRKKHQKTSPWLISTQPIEMASIIQYYGATQISSNCYVSFITERKCKLRVLLQHQNGYDKKLLTKCRASANRKINHFFGIRSSTSSWDIHHSARVNLVIVDNLTDGLGKLVQSTNTTILRTECIFTFVYIPNQKLLMVPALNFGNTYSQIKRYEIAVQNVSRIFL